MREGIFYSKVPENLQAAFPIPMDMGIPQQWFSIKGSEAKNNQNDYCYRGGWLCCVVLD